jgi:prevent-host-death family protein
MEFSITEVSISQFKARCLKLLEQVRRTRQPIRITRHGKPIAEVIPPTEIVDRVAWIDSMRDSIEIVGDIVSPANDEDE